MTTDITVLAQSLKAAAEKATPGRWEYNPGNTSIEYNVDSMDEDQGSIVYVDSGDFTQSQTDRNGGFIALANPANILALVEALEKAQQERENWHTSFDNERFRADKLAATLSNEIEQSANVRGQLLIAHKTLLNQQAKIAELKSRTVKLPKRSVGEVMHMSGFSRDYAEGWCAGNDNAIHEIHNSGIKVEG